ncbi:MAG: hypothetical protein WCJ57_01905 [Candidatus Falkowbacteria bacterium]
MGGFENSFNNFKPVSKEAKEEAFIAGMGKGAREGQLERKPDGFEAVHKVFKSKKQYDRKEKHKTGYNE